MYSNTMRLIIFSIYYSISEEPVGSGVVPDDVTKNIGQFLEPATIGLPPSPKLKYAHLSFFSLLFRLLLCPVFVSEW